MNNLFLTVTVGSDYRFLPKFLRYYHTIGVENFLIILNTLDYEVPKILKNFGIRAMYTWSDPFSERLKQYHEREVIKRHCSPEDWVLYTDLDEFQTYPESLEKCLQYCAMNGIDFLEGRMIDRISNSGDLIDINENEDLEIQFPMGGYLTNNLLKAWDKKIVVAKAKLTVGGGHHVFLDDKTREALPYKKALNRHSEGIEIHHFKWDREVLLRMENYVKLTDDSLFYWKREIIRFLKYFKKHKKILIKDRKLRIKTVSKTLNI